MVIDLNRPVRPEPRLVPRNDTDQILMAMLSEFRAFREEAAALRRELAELRKTLAPPRKPKGG